MATPWGFDSPSRHQAENTVRIELALISRLYRVAAKDWGIEGLRNPIQSLSMPGSSQKRERRLTPEEKKRLLEQLERTGPYMTPLASLAIESAMRQGELLALTWADVDPQKRVAKLHDTKNGEARDVPLVYKVSLRHPHGRRLAIYPEPNEGRSFEGMPSSGRRSSRLWRR